MKTALVAGATGLIGNELIGLLLQSGRYDEIKALTRRDLNKKHPKLKTFFIDYSNLEKDREQLRADDVFCCLGTTMAKAKSKENFREVDYFFPLRLAQTSHATGAQQFLLVSALGANRNSTVFYNRVKGETEESVSKAGFSCTHIFRPSLLLGPRQEGRPGEDAAKLFYKLFGFLIPDQYKAVDAIKVARAMLHFATLEQKGIFIHESKEIQNL